MTDKIRMQRGIASGDISFEKDNLSRIRFSGRNVERHRVSPQFEKNYQRIKRFPDTKSSILDCIFFHIQRKISFESIKFLLLWCFTNRIDRSKGRIHPIRVEARNYSNIYNWNLNFDRRKRSTKRSIPERSEAGNDGRILKRKNGRNRTNRFNRRIGEILPKVLPTRSPWCRVESSLFFVATVKGLSAVIDRSSVSP